MDRKLLNDQLTNNGHLKFRFLSTYVFLLKWVIPVAIGLVFINQFV